MSKITNISTVVVGPHEVPYVGSTVPSMVDLCVELKGFCPKEMSVYEEELKDSGKERTCEDRTLQTLGRPQGSGHRRLSWSDFDSLLT